MIERKFVSQKIKEHMVQEFIANELDKSGHNRIEIKRTPLGEKIIIYTPRPGLIVGRKGENIKKLTATLKNKFQMENPQIEVSEIEDPFLDPNAVVDKIVYTLERFGPKRFKFVGYQTLQRIMDAGALGAEIVIGGVGVPGARAKSWRFSDGYLKKVGNVSQTQVLRAEAVANLRRGSIGVKISILPPDLKLPDKILIKKEEKEVEKVEEKTQEIVKEEPEEKKEENEKKPKEEKSEENNKKTVKEKDGNNKKK